MRSDDDFREGTEKAARKESEVHPFVNGRRLLPLSDPGQGWVWGVWAGSLTVTGTPPGALFGPGSEIDSFWVSGQRQQLLLSLPRLL